MPHPPIGVIPPDIVLELREDLVSGLLGERGAWLQVRWSAPQWKHTFFFFGCSSCSLSFMSFFFSPPRPPLTWPHSCLFLFCRIMLYPPCQASLGGHRSFYKYWVAELVANAFFIGLLVRSICMGLKVSFLVIAFSFLRVWRQWGCPHQGLQGSQKEIRPCFSLNSQIYKYGLLRGGG